MDKDTQLPAEVLHEINMEGQELMANEPDNWWAYKKGAIKYATTSYQAQREIEQLKRWKAEASELLNPILDYGQSKEAAIPLGESITTVVLERCKQAKVASDLLTEVLVMNEMWGDLPGEFIKKVKTFLDGTK